MQGIREEMNEIKKDVKTVAKIDFAVLVSIVVAIAGVFSFLNTYLTPRSESDNIKHEVQRVERESSEKEANLKKEILQSENRINININRLSTQMKEQNYLMIEILKDTNKRVDRILDRKVTDASARSL